MPRRGARTARRGCARCARAIPRTPSRTSSARCACSPTTRTRSSTSARSATSRARSTRRAGSCHATTSSWSRAPNRSGSRCASSASRASASPSRAMPTSCGGAFRARPSTSRCSGESLTEASGVGARLKQEREAQGLAIDDVALQLKFAPRQIEFLEQDRFDRLPGPTIARGMVRNYARLLKLDPEPLVQRMAPQAEPAPDAGRIAERFRQRVPFSDSGRRSTLIYAGFSVALLVLVGVLAYEWQQQKSTPQFVAPALERPQPEPAQTASVVQPPAPAPEPAPAAPAVEPKPPVPAMAEQKKPVPVVVEKKPEAEQVAAAEKTLPPGQHSIVFRTQGEAWVEVKDGAGRLLISSLNPAGTERTLRGQPPFEIIVGNASSVRMTYDGKPVDLRPHTRVEVARFTLK